MVVGGTPRVPNASNKRAFRGKLSAHGVCRPQDDDYIGAMLSQWFRNRRRRSLLAVPFPDQWLVCLQSHVRQYPRLPAVQQQRVRNVVQVMVAEKDWAPAAGFAVTDEMRVTIAGTAGVMVSGVPEPFYFDRLETIVIHPRTVRIEAERAIANPWLPGGELLDGVAWNRGPVVLSWGAVLRERRGRSPGRNVVVHELAHHLDGLNGEMDGLPGQRTAEAERRWQSIARRELRRLQRMIDRGEPTLLDDYAAESPAEFFAVASESFFEMPRELRAEHPELYEALATLYEQSPVEWFS
jgi:Mlc titration factor MtfA (ptsG expression regulator)